MRMGVCVSLASSPRGRGGVSVFVVSAGVYGGWVGVCVYGEAAGGGGRGEGEVLALCTCALHTRECVVTCTHL